MSFTAKLAEPKIAEDRDSGDKVRFQPTTPTRATATSPARSSTSTTAIPEDYEQLKKLGIDVKGKIALARYGKSWRGTKAKVAQENGAVGCLIYSDPRDDGYFQGDIYPKGAFRPPDGAQRGSVMDMPLYPGDPLSPGWASEKGARKLPLEEADDTDEDSGVADLLRRCAAIAGEPRRTGRARTVARRAADHVSHRPGTGDRAHEGRIRLDDAARL